MTEPDALIAWRMREAFDGAFARAEIGPGEPLEDLLAIQVAGDAYALALSELAAIHRDRTIVPLPSDDPAFLGISGFRGTTAPVFDLRALLGYPPGPPPRWLVLARAASPVALAFERFDAHLRLPSRLIAPRAQEHARGHLRGAVHTGDALRPLIDVASLIEAIARRARPARPMKEP